MITKQQYDEHDCHLSPEDGCETCEQYENQRLAFFNQFNEWPEDVLGNDWVNEIYAYQDWSAK